MGLSIQVTAGIWFTMLFHHGAFASIFEERGLTITDFPPCSLQCMIPVVPTSGCAIDDISCICSNEKLTVDLSACLLANCTMADIQSTSRVQADLCHLPHESNQREMFWALLAAYVLIALSVGLRITGKWVAKRLSIDDLVLFIAFLMNAVPIGCTFKMIEIGLGLHLWDLEDGRLAQILRLFFIAAIVYVAVLGILKASVVLFYIQIFSTPRFRRIAYTVLALIAANTLVLCLVLIFACNPIPTFWNRDIKGKCLDVSAIGFAVGMSAIVQDVVLLVLPIVFLRSLNMDRFHKLAIGGLFSIGAFGCIATALRLKANPNFKTSLDPSWNYGSGMIWTDLEALAIYVCVSLPSIRMLLVRIMPDRVKTFFSNLSFRSRSSSSNKSPVRAQQQQQQGAGNLSSSSSTRERQRGAPRSFLSRILPHSELWSRVTTTRGGGGSRGFFSTNRSRNGSTVTITRRESELESGREEVELQESFSTYRKYWNKELHEVKVEDRKDGMDY